MRHQRMKFCFKSFCLLLLRAITQDIQAAQIRTGGTVNRSRRNGQFSILWGLLHHRRCVAALLVQAILHEVGMEGSGINKKWFPLVLQTGNGLFPPLLQ